MLYLEQILRTLQFWRLITKFLVLKYTETVKNVPERRMDSSRQLSCFISKILMHH